MRTYRDERKRKRSRGGEWAGILGRNKRWVRKRESIGGKEEVGLEEEN